MDKQSIQVDRGNTPTLEDRRNSNGGPYACIGQYSYTVQFGLTFFNARWLNPALGRFAQADTVIPEASQGCRRGIGIHMH